MSFVRSLKVDHAKGLLMDVERPLKEIARASGFADLTRFSRVFKSVTGQSPSEFRQRVLSQR